MIVVGMRNMRCLHGTMMNKTVTEDQFGQSELQQTTRVLIKITMWLNFQSNLMVSWMRYLHDTMKDMLAKNWVGWMEPRRMNRVIVESLYRATRLCYPSSRSVQTCQIWWNKWWKCSNKYLRHYLYWKRSSRMFLTLIMRTSVLPLSIWNAIVKFNKSLEPKTTRMHSS